MLFRVKSALSTEKGLKTQLSGPAPPGGTAAGRSFGGAELGRRRGGRRGAAAALEEAAQVLVDGIRTHHGAFGRLLHVVVEAQVGQIHVRAHGLVRVVDALAQLIRAGANRFQLEDQGGVLRQFGRVDKGGDEVRMQIHFIGEGVHHAAALRADVRHAALFLRAQVDEKGQLRLDGGKGCHDVRHVLRGDRRAHFVIVGHGVLGLDHKTIPHGPRCIPHKVRIPCQRLRHGHDEKPVHRVPAMIKPDHLWHFQPGPETLRAPARAKPLLPRLQVTSSPRLQASLSQPPAPMRRLIQSAGMATS